VHSGCRSVLIVGGLSVDCALFSGGQGFQRILGSLIISKVNRNNRVSSLDFRARRARSFLVTGCHKYSSRSSRTSYCVCSLVFTFGPIVFAPEPPNGFLTIAKHFALVMKPTRYFQRQVRRARHLPAWLAWQGQTGYEVQMLDVSRGGAKVITDRSATIPERFEMAFAPGDQKRRPCEVIWRRGKMIGIRFL
jgi:hypothetical protein